MHLNPYQDGCYRRLIDHYMTTRKAPPDNDAALARIVGDSLENWIALAAPVIREFFTSKNGFLFNKTCEGILADQADRNERYSERAKKGGKARSEKMQSNQGEKCFKQSSSLLNPATLQYSTIQDSKKEIVNILNNIPITALQENPSPPPSGGQKRGIRLEGFLKGKNEGEIATEWATWAQKELNLPMSVIDIELEKFSDYWDAKAGQHACKADWFKTWKNWMRRVKETIIEKEKRNEAFRNRSPKF